MDKTFFTWQDLYKSTEIHNPFYFSRISQATKDGPHQGRFACAQVPDEIEDQAWMQYHGHLSAQIGGTAFIREISRNFHIGHIGL